MGRSPSTGNGGGGSGEGTALVSLAWWHGEVRSFAGSRCGRLLTIFSFPAWQPCQAAVRSRWPPGSLLDQQNKQALLIDVIIRQGGAKPLSCGESAVTLDPSAASTTHHPHGGTLLDFGSIGRQGCEEPLLWCQLSPPSWWAPPDVSPPQPAAAGMVAHGRKSSQCSQMFPQIALNFKKAGTRSLKNAHCCSTKGCELSFPLTSFPFALTLS